MTIIRPADTVDDEFVYGEVVQAGRAAPGVKRFVLLERDIDGMLHGVTEANGCGRIPPAIGHEKRNDFSRVAAAVAECQHLFPCAEKIFIERLLEPGRHPRGQRRGIEISEIAHRLAAERELVEDFPAVIFRRPERA